MGGTRSVDFASAFACGCNPASLAFAQAPRSARGVSHGPFKTIVAAGPWGSWGTLGCRTRPHIYVARCNATRCVVGRKRVDCRARSRGESIAPAIQHFFQNGCSVCDCLAFPEVKPIHRRTQRCCHLQLLSSRQRPIRCGRGRSAGKGSIPSCLGGHMEGRTRPEKR